MSSLMDIGSLWQQNKQRTHREATSSTAYIIVSCNWTLKYEERYKLTYYSEPQQTGHLTPA